MASTIPISASKSPPVPRTYEDAITSLNTLQSNFAVLDAIRKSGGKKNRDSIRTMREWVSRIGYACSDFNRLNVVHVSGTKGKGSTCAMISHILTQYPDEVGDVGLYTSPHLRSVRERIRINNRPISKVLFARYFFEVWDRLETSAKEKGLDPAVKPMYFRYLTLMAFHVYMSEGVKAVVLEVGIGGEYDTTNVVEKPVATAITRLGIDHVNVLGATIAEIAWHKAGIMKKGTRCFSIKNQAEGAREVILKRAEEGEKRCEVVWVGPHAQVESGDAKLGLQGVFQRQNAALAMSVAAEALRGITGGKIDEDLSKGIPVQFRTALKDTVWQGRCQVMQDPERDGVIEWCLDGAHTIDSLEVAGQWFATRERELTARNPHRKTVLVFNQQTQRDAEALLRNLYHTLSTENKKGPAPPRERLFDTVIFSTNVTYKSGYAPDLICASTSEAAIRGMILQAKLAARWRSLDGDEGVEVLTTKTIEEAVEEVRKMGEAPKDGEEVVVVFVTGSLHLVGGVLEILEQGKEVSE